MAQNQLVFRTNQLKGKHPCPICGKVYNRKHWLQKHLKTVHDEESGSSTVESDNEVGDDDDATPKRKLHTPKFIRQLRKRNAAKKSGKVYVTRLKKHLPLLEYLIKANKKVVRVLINEADRDIINMLCECAHNTLNGNVRLSPQQFRRLKKYKVDLRDLTDSKGTIVNKKRVLQKGGFLPLLLSAALPLINSVVGAITGAIKRK